MNKLVKLVLSVLFTALIAFGLWNSGVSPSKNPLLSPNKVQQAESINSLAVRTGVRIIVGKESATCFFVRQPKGPTVLVTAAHTFKKSNSKIAKLVTRNNGQREEVELRVRSEDGKPLWIQHPNQDIAVLKFDFDSVKNLDSTEIHRIAAGQVASAAPFKSGTIEVGMACVIPCFPAKLESTSQGYPVLRSGTLASHPLDPTTQNTFLVDYGAFGGDSGAPVITSMKSDGSNERELVVVGMVIAQARQTDKSITPFEERIQHTPVGLGIAVNAALVCETLAMAEGS